MVKPYRIIKADPIFVKELDEIKAEKLKNHTWITKHRRPIGDRRLTKALRKLSFWGEIKRVLVEERIKEDFGENE